MLQTVTGSPYAWGLASSASARNASAAAFSLGGRPERGSSSRPRRPPARNRARQARDAVRPRLEQARDRGHGPPLGDQQQGVRPPTHPRVGVGPGQAPEIVGARGEGGGHRSTSAPAAARTGPRLL